MSRRNPLNAHLALPETNSTFLSKRPPAYAYGITALNPLLTRLPESFAKLEKTALEVDQNAPVEGLTQRNISEMRANACLEEKEIDVRTLLLDEEGTHTMSCVALSNIVPGVLTPVLAKHTKHLSLVDILSVGVDRMQRNFEPMRSLGNSNPLSTQE